MNDEDMAKLSLPELIELAIDILEDMKLRLMQAAGEARIDEEEI